MGLSLRNDALVDQAKRDPDFLGRLLSENDRFIWKLIARTASQRSIRSDFDNDDLFQIASIGFIKAVRSFDPGRGAKFTTFAASCIIQELLNATYQRFGIRVPRSIYDSTCRVVRIKNALKEGSSSFSEVAKEAHLTETEVVYLLNSLVKPSSLDYKIAGRGSEEDAVSFEEMVEDPVDVEEAALGNLVLWEFVNRLKPREREILRCKLAGMSQKRIASRLGVSQTTVSRMLAQMREKFERMEV